MKNLIDVLYKIDREIWMIDPIYLRNMRDTVVARLGFNADLVPMDDQDNDEDDFEMDVPGFKEIYIYGPLSCNPSIMEQLFGACDVNKVYAAIQDSGNDPSIDKLLLCFNSPGGEVTKIEELGELIAEISTRKTVIAYVDGVMASAAYWLGSQANSLVTTKSAKIGSVGVYSLLIDASEQLKEAGIKVNAIVSEKSPMKLAGAQWKPLTDKEKAMFQDQIEKTDAKFRAAILSKRNIKSEYMDGRIFDGEEAVQYGYADAIVKDKQAVYEMLLV